MVETEIDRTGSFRTPTMGSEGAKYELKQSFRLLLRLSPESIILIEVVDS
jgi:hypothetical protein